MLGSLNGLHIAENLAIISDDAGQFNVLSHGLCWVHAERLVHKLRPLNEQHRIDIASVRSQTWDRYGSASADGVADFPGVELFLWRSQACIWSEFP